MLPAFERATCLAIGEPALVYVGVDGLPVDGKWPKPHGKVGFGTFSQGLITVNLDENGRWGQGLQHAGIVVKGHHGRLGCVYGKSIVKLRHHFLR
jgi:hypothetical protein